MSDKFHSWLGYSSVWVDRGGVHFDCLEDYCLTQAEKDVFICYLEEYRRKRNLGNRTFIHWLKPCSRRMDACRKFVVLCVSLRFPSVPRYEMVGIPCFTPVNARQEGNAKLFQLVAKEVERRKSQGEGSDLWIQTRIQF